MESPQMKYEYVDLNDKYMSVAYTYGKRIYMQHNWNHKTIPIAIIVKDGKYISKGICSDGGHAKEGRCDRLKEAGTDYDSCPHCKEEEHAERKALIAAYDKDLNGAVIYVYGHYKLCSECILALNARGITKCILLENSDILFNRHDKRTVLGTPDQFTT